jgi:hypothetical protein
VAQGLAPAWNIIHAVNHPDNTATTPGQSNVEDPDIAKWVADSERVLVTIDSDFRTRWIKTGLLQRHGVEVIVFTQDLKGLREQFGRVVKHLPYWATDLREYPYGYRVWEQSQKLRPRIVDGSKQKL